MSTKSSQSCFVCKKPFDDEWAVKLANGELVHDACLVKSSQSSKSELNNIIDDIAYYCAHTYKGKPGEPETLAEVKANAKTALLQLALSCLPEKIEPVVDVGIPDNKISEAYGHNAAIDTIEQNILGRFS